MTRLLIRGGSIAAGYKVERGYADILRDWGAARGIELINCSRPGENTFDAVRTFHDDIAPFKPDMLIIHFGLTTPSAVYINQSSRKTWCSSCGAAASCFTQSSSCRPRSPLKAHPICSRLISTTRSSRDVCGDLGCEMVPVYTYWSGLVMERGLRHADLVQENVLYPNERGHDFFAQAIIQRLERILSGRESEARRQGC